MTGTDCLRALRVRVATDLDALGWKRAPGACAFVKERTTGVLELRGKSSKWRFEDAGGIELTFELRGSHGLGARRLSDAMGPSPERDAWVTLRDDRVRAAQSEGRARDVRILGVDRPENYYADVWMWLNTESDVERWAPILVAALTRAETQLEAARASR
jgi:hypothetical protein